tara:strand:- start:559 stop:969 length:411 start_codon:yes stop_codon:yes gene_type:complete
MYNKVFFNNTPASFGNLLYAKQLNKRLWVIKPTNLSSKLQQFLNNFTDCKGSLGHFENKTFIQHISTESPSNCICLLYPETYLFEQLSYMSENKQNEILSLIKFCPHAEIPCYTCYYCKKYNQLAEEYGIYDILDN